MRDECHKLVKIPSERLQRHRDTEAAPWYDKCLNSGVNMLKNSITFFVSVPINLSAKLRFLSANGTREVYFVDAPSKCLVY